MREQIQICKDIQKGKKSDSDTTYESDETFDSDENYNPEIEVHKKMPFRTSLTWHLIFKFNARACIDTNLSGH